MGKLRVNYCGINIAAFVFLQIISICSSWPLSTKSRWIVDDASGQRVKLACVNWASHMEPMIAEGLEKKPMSEIARKITASGFNCVRFTWATHMYTRPEYRSLKVSESLDRYNLSAARDGIVRNNPQILSMTVVELHKAVVDELGRNKLMVVLDNHIGRPGWCCSDNDGNGFFNDRDFNPWEWERGLITATTAYKGNPAVVGMSIRNELRGSRQNELNWYQYMRIGANMVHNENPDVLVIISGLSYAGNLAFFKSQMLDHIPSNKSLFEGHWYSFGIPADIWAAQTNQICASVTKAITDNLLFLIQGDNPFPFFLSEFGINQRGDNEADNRYIGCLLATVAELDLDWALWALQGSYLLREGTVNHDEVDGVLDFNWDRLRNPAFLDRLQAIQQINQDFKSNHPTYYKMFHPLSGHCVQIVENGIVVADCKNASKWEQHQDDGPIKLVGSPQCLGVAGDGVAPRVSEDCSSKWKYVSSSGLHLAAQGGNGGYLCLEMNTLDSKLVTKKCLCVGDDLVDLSSCADDPQAQWFKFIPSNIWEYNDHHSHGLSAPLDYNSAAPFLYLLPLSLSHTLTHKPEITSHCTATKSKGEGLPLQLEQNPEFQAGVQPQRATAELRHSSSIGNRATPSPSASAVASSPFSSDYNSATSAADDDNGRDRHPRDRSFRSYFQSFFPHFLFPNDDLHRSHPHRSKISIVILVAIVFAAVISVSSLVQRLNAPYLCKKDGITLQCPHVKEPPSLWENPHSATTSWKPCAERREGVISDLPSENSTSGYIFIHAEGGLNQQRIAICNAVAVAKILNATLILPVLKQDQIWKDQTKFEDIFDVDHFIDYLKDDVTIVRDIPEWFTDKAELFSSIRRTVKNIPKYASAQFYIDNVLPRVKEKKIMALKPFVDRLGYDNVPQEINRLRCRVNYHALKFLPEIENMADLLVSRMRNRTGNSNPFMALHLRFEKGMVGLSFCDFVGTRIEKALMAIYRLKEWPRRFKDGSHLWALALQKRKEGRCPLEPGEVAVMLRAMGYPKETQIYVASGQVYGGQNRMAPLRNMFPNLVTKEELATKLELDEFRKHVTSLAALDFLVCLKSDVFVMTHGGNFAKLIIGNRRYLGHHLKSIKPDKGLMSKSLGDPYMGWATFVEDVITTHQTRSGLPEETFPNYDIWENPLTPCMCRT